MSGIGMLERAVLFPVSGNNDEPNQSKKITVQFNPTTLKVSLSNTLSAPKKGAQNSRAAQYVDKSSATLTVELVFDTTYVEAASQGASAGDQLGSSGGSGQIKEGSDVRDQTRKIAETFMKPTKSGDKMLAPSRMLFQWGTFEFVGMVQSFDETLDFFSPEGRPLRASVSLKLSEDAYQFRQNSKAKAAKPTPALALTGAPGNGTGGHGTIAKDMAPRKNKEGGRPVPGGSKGSGNWRDSALFNGIETPRLPSVPALALPAVGLSSAIGLSGAIGTGRGGVAPISGAQPATASGTAAGSHGTATAAVTPPFRYGNSASLGTGIPGAFAPELDSGLPASSLQAGSLQLRAPTAATSASGASVPAPASARDAATGGRTRHGVSVTNLLKRTTGDGVGFD
jgi:hypothetical protein